MKRKKGEPHRRGINRSDQSVRSSHFSQNYLPREWLQLLLPRYIIQDEGFSSSQIQGKKQGFKYRPIPTHIAIIISDMEVSDTI